MTYARFDPYDPVAVQYLLWFIQTGKAQVTAWDMSLSRETTDISSSYSPYREFVGSPYTDVEINITIRGQLGPGDVFTYTTQPESSEPDTLPPGIKALP